MALNVGYIGLGHMGWHMAKHFAQAGHQSIVFNRKREIAEAFVDEYGGEVVETPAEAALGAAFFGRGYYSCSCGWAEYGKSFRAFSSGIGPALVARKPC